MKLLKHTAENVSKHKSLKIPFLSFTGLLDLMSIMGTRLLKAGPILYHSVP